MATSRRFQPESKDTIEDLAIDFSVKMAIESRREEGRTLKADEIEDLIRRCCRENQRALIACLQSLVLTRSEIRHNYLDSWLGRRNTYVILKEEKERIEGSGFGRMGIDEVLAEVEAEGDYRSLLLATFYMLHHPCDFKDTERNKVARAWRDLYRLGCIPPGFKFTGSSQVESYPSPENTPSSSMVVPSSIATFRKASTRPSPSTAIPILEDLISTLKTDQRTSAQKERANLLEICRKLHRDLLGAKINNHRQGQLLSPKQKSAIRSSVSRIYSIKSYSQRVKLLGVSVHLRYALGQL